MESVSEVEAAADRLAGEAGMDEDERFHVTMAVREAAVNAVLHGNAYDPAKQITFTKEESTVFGDIANARAGMLNAQGPEAKIAANNRLDGAIGRLLLLTENYPQLRSSDQFMRLQDELAGTENRIGVARKRYNDALKDYNTFVLEFPNNIWANIAGFHQNNAYFSASPAAQAVPEVKF